MECTSAEDFFEDDGGDDEGIESQGSPNDTLLTKNSLMLLMSQESERIGFVAIEGKAQIYKNFEQITIDNKKIDFVACSKCKSLYVWTKVKGTHSLHRHSCETTTKTRGPNKPISSTMDKFVKKVVPEASLRQLNKNITFGLVKDLRPLYSVERIGFKHLAQALINFGAKFGIQNVADCIANRTTLQRYQVPALVEDVRNYYRDILKATATNKFAFSEDLWSEKYDQRHFLSITLHFINNDWELLAITLGLEEVVETKTTDNLRTRFEEILKRYFDEERVPLILEESFNVSDGGKNLLKILRHHRPCECHKLHCFVDWTLNEKPLGKRDQKKLDKGLPVKAKNLFHLPTSCPTISKTLTSVKELVTYFKRTALNSKLPTTLKQDVSTRWDSELNMLESYVKVKTDIEALLLENREFERLSGIDNGMVDELIDFFTPIRKCSRLLSGDKYATIHLVAVQFSKLKLDIAIKETDSTEIELLKQQALVCFDEYLVTDVFLCMACLLHPKYRQLRFVDVSDKVKAIELLKKLVEEQHRLKSATTKQVPCVSKCTSTKKSTGFEQFEDVVEQHVETSEVDAYLNHTFDLTAYIDEHDHFDVLKFWRETNSFPNIKEVARFVLAIPAAETSDERTFSSAGEVLTPRRTSVEGSTLGDFVFIHKSPSGPPIF